MTPLITLDGKTVIVTGAAQGIGAKLVEKIVELGGTAVAVDLNGAKLAETTASYGDRVLALVGNVTDAAFATASVERAVATFGKVDGLVNNAGVARPALIEKMTMDDWQTVIDVHLTGSYLWLQAVGRHMIERAKAGEERPGSIVNVSSDAGRRGSFGQINYSAAKAGQLGMTMTAAREWAKHKIRTNSVCFGVVETPMTEVVRSEKMRERTMANVPLGYFATTDDVVPMILMLLSDTGHYITGQHISVNGGFHISL